MSRLWRLALGLVLASAQAGCVASRQASPEVGSIAPGHSDANRAPTPVPASAHAHRPRESRHPRNVVLRARLPYHGVRASGETLAPEELLSELGAANVICVGEEHTNPHHHYAQLVILRGLIERSQANGKQIGLGFEMFRLEDQATLDAYRDGEIGERQLLEDTRYREHWGYDFALYRPLFVLGRRHAAALLALNVAPELTRKIAKEGLAALTPEQTKALPELDLDNAEHRRMFDRSMSEHPPTATSSDFLYAAQVTWDETMAEAAARWVNERRPARQLVIVAGTAHCHSTAIPARLLRRSGGAVVSVRPVVQRGEPRTAVALEGYDYALVMTATEGEE